MALDKSRISQIFEHWGESFKKDAIFLTNKFQKCSTDIDRADFVKKLLDKYPIDVFSTSIGKNNAVSKSARQLGNTKYVKKDWDNALECYAKSVAYAEKDSEELAMALGNRAACLLNLGFIAEALVDVSRALEVPHIDESYRDKLSSRKDVCMARVIETRVFSQPEKVQEIKNKHSYFDSCCSKLELKENEEMGRYMVATDDIKTGEVLLVEKPYSSVVLDKAFYIHCAKCFVRYPLLIECPNCPAAMYCSTDCLNSHKKVHYYECAILEHIAQLELGAIGFLSVRILIDGCLGETPINMLKEGDVQDDTYRASDIRRVFNLVGNRNKRSVSDLFRRGFSATVLVKSLKQYTNFFNDFAVTESEARGFILHFLMSLPCNAHEVTGCHKSETLEAKEIGAAVYSTLSLINHSCEPNAVRHSFGEHCIIRAIRPIRAGEEVVDNYGYHYATHTKTERQEALMRQYYFQCACIACLNNWPVYEKISTKEPEFKNTDEHKHYNKLAEKFNTCLQIAMDEKTTEDDLDFLCSFLDYLYQDLQVQRPWQVFNSCQEAIKHTLHWFGGYNRT